ncbi:uncharacterized protein L969DRAFT_47941 [Mixia osmundae IAM 14324]|uniref:Uncharacterized protein n=1 Tax=Mixia osmundae (strain CBS 9802 / IAM 14324 / JCM 22182 / KY 12970) TaxID=764103 RepID=G7E9U2_MIXOS|nr:uncharacterized protein L969DRAFT_47941 [Mixia osmundae IAM 14324]KEI40044.1 hypothetical protein L969DRAFT_47941 [Mixia osmundae IAM 14324]GAA99411.1 hypothetical protein E5Q_06109 [Mixia osmundae IAM 14324]
MQRVNKFLYGPSPEERVRGWQQELRKEQRLLDREIRQLQHAQSQTQGQLKQLAKKGEVKNARLLAREFVRSRKQTDRLNTSKARLNSIHMQLQHQLATLKITGNLQRSTEIMKLSNSLIRLPELSATMRNMSMEMTKAGIMSEMVDDTMDMIDDEDDELEGEADAEVDKVLFEITNGKLGEAGRATAPLPEVGVSEEEQAEGQRMQAQLDALLSS